MQDRLSTKVLDALEQGGLDFFVSVPCILLANLIGLLERRTDLTHIPVTREEEGIGVCTGAFLGGRSPCILMQNSGLGNSTNALASLAKLYRIPIVMLVTHRGSPGERIEAQVPMGRITPQLLQTLEIPTLSLSDPSRVEEIEAMVRRAKEIESPVAILLDFAFFRGRS